MLNEQTIAILNSLKLFGMARGLSERLTDPPAWRASLVVI
jgi:hypothetical protein